MRNLGLGLGGLAMLSLNACSLPKNVTYEDLNNISPETNISDVANDYVLRETKKMAADSDREADCLHKLGLEGKLYPTKAAFFKENDECVEDLAALQTVGYLLVGAAVDYGKGWLLSKMMGGGKSSGSSNPSNPPVEPPVGPTSTISSGSGTSTIGTVTTTTVPTSTISAGSSASQIGTATTSTIVGTTTSSTLPAGGQIISGLGSFL